VGHRSRLVVTALTTTVLTGVIGFFGVLPVVHSLQADLQAEYDAAPEIPEAARMVRAEYYGAALWTLIALAIVLFCAGAAYVAATTPPSRRPTVPRDLGRLGAGLLVAQAPLSIAAGVWGSYSPMATVGGAVLGAVGSLVLALDSAPSWARASVCAAAGAATLIVAQQAVLLLPLTVGVTGLLVAAAATTAVNGPREQETHAQAADLEAQSEAEESTEGS
jgi:hypothetical protein